MMTSLVKTPSGQAQFLIADRMPAYGNPLQNFNRIAALWNAALGERLTSALVASDVAQMLRLVKESRLCESPDHFDSLQDICAYADLQMVVSNKESELDSGEAVELKPGISVWVYGDDREWFLSNKLSKDGDLWTAVCGSDLRQIEMHHIRKVQAA
jgi:hypothetical protein